MNFFGTRIAPHHFKRRGWRWWICDYCFAPKSLHPRLRWVVARPWGRNEFIGADAPHFKEGW